MGYVSVTYYLKRPKIRMEAKLPWHITNNSFHRWWCTGSVRGSDRVLVELSKTNLMRKNQLGDNVVLSWVVVLQGWGIKFRASCMYARQMLYH